MVRSIFEVKLDKEFGYCLVAVLDYAGYGMGESQAILPLAWFSTTPAAMGHEEIERLDDLAAPILSLSKPPRRGVEKWRKLHEFEDRSDFNLPICICDFTSQSQFLMNWNELSWEVIYSMDTRQKESQSFCAIAHLSDWSMGNRMYVKTHLTMLWMHVQGVDITAFYNINLSNTDEQYLYKRVMNMRLYADVPKEFHNRVWPGGCK